MLISATALLLAGRFRTGVVLFAAGLAVALAGF